MACCGSLGIKESDIVGILRPLWGSTPDTRKRSDNQITVINVPLSKQSKLSAPTTELSSTLTRICAHPVLVCSGRRKSEVFVVAFVKNFLF